MKTYGTSAVCPKCGKRLYASAIDGYSFVCKECDRKFYTVKTKENLADYWEINFPLTLDDWERNLSQWREICDKYNCYLLCYDNISELMDVGWESGFPESKILNKFIKEIENHLKR